MSNAIALKTFVYPWCRALTTVCTLGGKCFAITVSSARTLFNASQSLLVISRDVKMNPGPEADGDHILSILLRTIGAKQTDMLAKVASLESGQKGTDISVQQLFLG